MAKLQEPPLSNQLESVIVAFRFQVNSTSDPDNVVGGAQVVTEISNSSGVVTCTLAPEYRFPVLIACHVGVEGDLTNSAQFTSYTQSTGALVVTTFANDGTPAAAEATDDVWVHVIAVFCRRNDMAPTESV